MGWDDAKLYVSPQLNGRTNPATAKAGAPSAVIAAGAKTTTAIANAYGHWTNAEDTAVMTNKSTWGTADGLKHRDRLEVLHGMQDYVAHSLQMLRLSERVRSVDDCADGELQIDTDTSTEVTRQAYLCTALMWFCAGVDTSGSKRTQAYAQKWRDQLPAHLQEEMQELVRLRNTVHAHSGGTGAPYTVRVDLQLGESSEMLGNPSVRVIVDNSGGTVRRLLRDSFPEHRLESLEYLIDDALRWLTEMFHKEMKKASSRLLEKHGRKPEGKGVFVVADTPYAFEFKIDS